MFFEPSKPLTQLEEKVSTCLELTWRNILSADDDLMVFVGVTEEDILSEITEEMENDDGKDDDTDPSQSLLTS
ncbi:hypothetical protein AVEN_102996-1 [Araneus ventricosus]|uniref:Uncharacterized protein n=1 Tax=Araneus ventricosus TaxID=182803 RepID=A0A4Y2B976_ARAVE|nr:hypothetical protein AVEN_102996-1 [Araneus ventricosus]